MGSSAEELVLRISGDSSGGQEAVKAVETRVTELSKHIDELKPSTDHAGAAFTDLKKTLSEMWEHPTQALGDFSKAIAGDLTASLGGAETTMGAAVIGIGALAGGAAVAGGILFELSEKAIETGEALNDFSEKTSIGVEAASQLDYVAKVAGSSLDQMGSAIFMMQKRMADDSSGSFAAALEKIHLSVQEIEALTPDQQFIKIAEAFKENTTQSDRASVAMALFGRAGRDLAPLLMKDLGDINDQAKELGHTMSAETAKGMEDLAMAWRGLKESISWTTTEIGVGTVHFFQDLGSAINQAAYFLDPLSSDLDVLGKRIAGDLPKVKDAITGFEMASGKVALSAEEAKAASKDLDDETKAHIDALAKHKVAVDSIVASLMGESTKTKETKEAIDLVIASHTTNTDVIARTVAAIEKLKAQHVDVSASTLQWAKDNATIAGSLDNIGMRLSQVGVLVPENTEHIEAMADAFEAAADTPLPSNLLETSNALSSVSDIATDFTIPTLNDLIPVTEGVSQGFTDAAFGAKSFGEEMAGSLETALQKMPSTMARAFEGGGGLKGAAQALGSKFGADFGKSIVGEEGSGGLGDSLTKHLGDTLGGIVGAAIPAVGALIGPLIGKLFSIGGPSQQELDGRKVESSFEGQFGSFQKMMDAVGAAYAATGKSAQQAQADVQALMNAEKQGGAATQAMVAQINGAFDDQKQDAADLDAAIKRYGFSIAELGPTMQKQNLDAQAKQLITDWTALEKSGANVVTVDQKMASSVWDYLQMAKKTGMEVPQAMQPVIQSMIDQGVFTDENGQKITDMKDLGVTFAQTMTEGFDKVVAKLNELLVQMGKVPSALAAIQPIPAPWANWGSPPGLPDYGDGAAIPMASGGMGRVTRPTLFLAGEAGPEDVAFSGGGKSFKGGGMGGGVVVNVTVEGNVSTERDLADAISQYIANDFLLQGGALPLGVSR